MRLAGGAPEDAAFEPVLLERVPEGAAAYLGVRSALRLARLLGRLGAAGPLEAVRAALPDEAGVDLDRDLLAPLAGEVALAVTGPAEDPEGTGGGAPVVTLKARTADPRAHRGRARAAPGAARAPARAAGHRARLQARDDRRPARRSRCA